MNKEDCKTIIFTCKKKGRKSSQTAINKDVAYTKCQLSELSSTLNEMKACISTFSSKPQGDNSSEANRGQDAPISVEAGNSCGKRASKWTKTWFARPLTSVLFGLLVFIKFYLLTRLGGYKPTTAKNMKTSQIEQVVNSVLHKMGPTMCLSTANLSRNSANE